MHWLMTVVEGKGRLAGTVAVPNGTPPAEAWAAVTAAAGMADDELAAAVAARYRMAVAVLEAAEARALRLLPEPLARKYVVYPLRETDRQLIVATGDPMNLDAEQAVSFAAGRTVRFEIAPPARILGAIDAHYSPNRVVESLVQNVHTGPDDHVAVVAADEAGAVAGAKEIESEPVVQLTNVILRAAITEGASDIHLEPGASGGMVRLRVDGVLREYMPLPLAALARVVARIKVLASLDIADRLRPQDGRARIRIGDRLFDLRVSTVPTRESEKAVIRVLDPRGFRSLDDLQLPATELARVRALLQHRSGLVLVTGPTGSGKTTTLYAALKELAGATVNITTVEDPVEYELPGITQIQVDPKRNVTFPNALRSILRQDPDIVLIGEIRDLDTAQIAVQAALTGHLVLATLHANDAIAAIARLRDLGVEQTLLADTVRGTVAQRLARRVCPACAVRLDDGGGNAPGATAVPVGCRKCGGTGFRGRVMIVEVAQMTPALADLVIAGAGQQAMLEAARADGMRVMRETGMERVRDGTTTVGEVARVLGEAPPEDRARRTDAPRVMVADDDAIGRMLARGVLEGAGCRVIEAGDGEDAMRRIEAGEHVDLVVLDLEMPRMGGREVLGRLRGNVRTAGVPVVVLTGSDEGSLEAQLMEEGADDYVRKPLDAPRFAARVRAALRRRAS